MPGLVTVACDRRVRSGHRESQLGDISMPVFNALVLRVLCECRHTVHVAKHEILRSAFLSQSASV